MSPVYLIISAVLTIAVVLAERSPSRIIRELEQCITHEEVDGCSIPFNSSFPYRKVFKSACNRHDVCYRCGDHFQWSRNDCDVGFLYDMYYACAIHGIKHDGKTRRSIIQKDVEKHESLDQKKEEAQEEQPKVNRATSKDNKDNTLIKHDTAIRTEKSTEKKAVAFESGNNVHKAQDATKREQEDEEKELEKAAMEVSALNSKEVTKIKKSEHTKRKTKEGRELSNGRSKSSSSSIEHRKSKERKETNVVSEEHAKSSKKSFKLGHPKHPKFHTHKQQKSEEVHSCHGKTNCHSEKQGGEMAHSTKSHESSIDKLKLISNKYHEIEKLLGELNVLIKTEATQVESRKENMLEKSTSIEVGSSGEERDNLTKNGNATRSKLGNETIFNSSMLGVKTNATRSVEAINGTNVKKVFQKKQGVSHTKYIHRKDTDKHLQESGKVEAREKEKKEEELADSNSMISKSFSREMSKDLLANENYLLPRKNSLFVKCKLAAYLYFVAVRGFGQKFYRHKSPDWCRNGCQKSDEKPRLEKLRNRPR
ncbi:intersectin-1-like [Rhopilema esculentum]|uniref:intersectin-1-like n=1 Tax=Rhopilema esculentum TaxID=499914 RepID=UPI0031CDEAA0|eukprot:gene1295-15682_t